MPDDVGFVVPLTGEEIVIDVCNQIAEKLRRDCNLRDADSYQGGYSAKITVHLEAYGMDTATVAADIVVGVAREKVPERADQVFDTTVEIPVEPALDMVRERSEQPVPTLTIDTGGQPMVRPRRYVRRDKVVAGGGAMGETLE